MNLRDLDREGLRRLNSATKYPSIPTYHEMGDRGCLTDAVTVPFDEDDHVLVTEKVDGTNARIVALPNARGLRLDVGYLVGSRNDLLTASGDLVHNPRLGIVDALHDVLDRMTKVGLTAGHAYVFYGEVYGGTVGKGARQYTGDESTGFRLFDVVLFAMGELDALVRDNDPEAMSLWRKGGGQNFGTAEEVAYMADVLEVPTVPSIEHDIEPLPTSIEETLEWLRILLEGGTGVALDPGAGGKAEGVVVRTPDRRKVAKIRFQDYERTLRERLKRGGK